MRSGSPSLSRITWRWRTANTPFGLRIEAVVCEQYMGSADSLISALTKASDPGREPPVHRAIRCRCQHRRLSLVERSDKTACHRAEERRSSGPPHSLRLHNRFHIRKMTRSSVQARKPNGTEFRERPLWYVAPPCQPSAAGRRKPHGIPAVLQQVSAAVAWSCRATGVRGSCA